MKKSATSGPLGRKEFLKTMGIGGVSLILPGMVPKPDLVSGIISQPIKIYDNYLRGVQYYELGKYLDELNVGDGVSFTRFPEHEYDRFAVGVTWQGHFLGYLPAYENIVLANLLDAGVRLSGMVTAKHSLQEVGIGVWAELITLGSGNGAKLSDTAADEVEDWYRR